MLNATNFPTIFRQIIKGSRTTTPADSVSYKVSETVLEWHEGELSSGVTVYYSIDTSGDSYTGETVLAPINALCSYDGGYYLLVQSENRPDNAIDPAQVGESVTNYPEGYYALPVEVGDYNGNFIQISSGVERDATVFLRYVNTAPSRGNTTSDVDEEGDDQMGRIPSGDFVGGMPGRR